MKPDDHPSKKRMKGQTEVKHDILEKYLEPWLSKITEVESEIHYIDGFAGWGKYEDGSIGSPLIAMNTTKEMIEQKHGLITQKLKSFKCYFIENDEVNYSELKNEVDRFQEDCPPQIEAFSYNMEFADFAEQYFRQGLSNPSPAFIFIDPFGFSGVPFEIVEKLVNLRTTGVEVFITFMSGKMAQYMENKEHEVAITEILGTNQWKELVPNDLSKNKRAERFVQIYENQLRNEAEVEYVWPFEMTEETKRQNCYYLVHATNHFEGFKLMKDIMYNAGAEDQFAYLGPDHYPYINEQEGLGAFGAGVDDEQKNVEGLADFLHEEYKGESITFYNLLKETYEETTLIEKHYRDACKHLQEQRRATIDNVGKENGGTIRGLNGKDMIEFKIGGLNQFLN